MRLRRPSWMEPVDSFGEWFGLIGGGVVLAAVVFAIVDGLPFHPGLSLHLAAPPAGWSCLDPTDPCNWSSYRVRNDTGHPVVLRECDHVCERSDGLGDPVEVAPGATTSDDVYEVSAIVGERTWWLVSTTAGRRLGCLVLDGHPKKRDGDVVLVSERGPCGVQRTPPTRPAASAS